MQWELQILIGRVNQNVRLDGLPRDAWRLRERLIFIWRAIVKWSCASNGGKVMRRSQPNHDAIGLRSPRDRGLIATQSRPRSPLTDEPRSSCDHGHQIRLSTEWNGQIFRGKSPLKMMYSFLFFLSLDWIVKELSDLKERSWVLRDSPAFRLDFNQNWSGIDHEFHRISSNFPLERRTSARKKSSQIYFNPSELKPHPCGNRVSSEIRSIIRW